MSQIIERKHEIIKRKNKRIALVNPPYSSTLYGNERSVKSKHPPLNLLYLHSYIRDYSEVRIFDGETIPLEELFEGIKEFNPDIIGYTSTSPTYPIAKAISQKLRRDDNLQIIGGPYATVVSQETLRDFDIAIIGEGEETLKELIQGRSIESIKGLAFNGAWGEHHFTGNRLFREDLDKLPFPSWDLVDFTQYRYSTHRGGNKKSAPIITSRGCPFNCSTCSTNLVNGPKIRYRSIENVVKEVDELITNYGIRHLHFLDDTFTFNKKRLRDLCDMLAEKNITFSCNTRPDVFSEDDADYILFAGCTNVFFGVESANNEILGYFNRRMTRQKIINSFRACEKRGIQTTASFMIGSPLESEGTLIETLELAKKLRPDYVLFNILTPHKGTRVYYEAVREGILEPYEVDLEKFPKEPVGIPMINNPNFSRGQIQEWKERLYSSYYGCTNYLFNQLLHSLRTRNFKNIQIALKLRRTYKK